MSTPKFQDWMLATQRCTEAALERLLPPASQVPERLHEAMRYTTLGGGKRVRPLLAFAAGEVAGADAARVEIAASALECIHVYSLVHDDMPCMDDDDLRRGKPTVHIQYDEATALLVGDALQTLAFELLSHNVLSDDATRQLRVLQVVSRASGSRGMAGGQAIDLASVGKALTRPELEFMHIHKTGALIRAAVLTGALLGEVSDEELERLDHYAKCIGLLFQVVDDILDTVADTATLGKTAGKDAANDKPTYVSILGLEESRELARELATEAHAALAGFGDRALRLRELTDYIVSRPF
ncbi:polyprenyl synthetase family protein [Uliginosibacterium sp. H1]|uniref:polyprenyl synthetase family protein n=1 Tax=Uliginosibacterium sp. H1 TaxID=3114757 RepID=UPI002E17DDC8|nr:farnesyl diphosphate synthase [Uliginosibacterium sp. H1]